mmetsp:Transcript_1848/g.6599  ORF Transcript_1848/g.6599 Transcript_1848/m.6599 type:complete len:257 (+) Transcript_1848:167-937(+)
MQKRQPIHGESLRNVKKTIVSHVVDQSDALLGNHCQQSLGNVEAASPACGTERSAAAAVLVVELLCRHASNELLHNRKIRRAPGSTQHMEGSLAVAVPLEEIMVRDSLKDSCSQFSVCVVQGVVAAAVLDQHTLVRYALQHCQRSSRWLVAVGSTVQRRHVVAVEGDQQGRRGPLQHGIHSVNVASHTSGVEQCPPCPVAEREKVKVWREPVEHSRRQLSTVAHCLVGRAAFGCHMGENVEGHCLCCGNHRSHVHV